MQILWEGGETLGIPENRSQQQNNQIPNMVYISCLKSMAIVGIHCMTIYVFEFLILIFFIVAFFLKQNLILLSGHEYGRQIATHRVRTDLLSIK